MDQRNVLQELLCVGIKLGNELYDEFFGSFAGIRVGSYPLSDIVFFQPGSYVHEQEDKNWGRLQAWFNAFYELQK